MPSSMVVASLKPTSLISSSTSAYVDGTSPACRGWKFFCAGLGGQANDQVELIFCEQPLHGIPVSDVGAQEMKILFLSEHGQPRLFQGYVIVGIQVVDAGYGIAMFKQAAGQVKADEAGGAGD